MALLTEKYIHYGTDLYMGSFQKFKEINHKILDLKNVQVSL